MTLMMFFFDPNCMFFTSAFLLVMVMLGVELVGFMFAGMDLFAMIDSILPDFDTDSPDFDDGPVFYQLLGCAKHKNVPLAIWGVVLRALFAVVGAVLQIMMYDHFGHTMNLFAASVLAAIPAFATAKVITKGLGEKVFVDSSVAVSKEDLVGCKASITVGEAEVGRPAECKVVDKYGKSHYLMGVPFEVGSTLKTGQGLVVVKVLGSTVVVDVDPA